LRPEICFSTPRAITNLLAFTRQRASTSRFLLGTATLYCGHTVLSFSTIAAFIGFAEKRDGLPDGEHLVFGICSSRRPFWADRQPFFFALAQNSILYVKEMSPFH
jgi:hypothetical protein